MIPMQSGTSGIKLMALLVTVGAVDLTTLLHFTILPANKQARQEFRHQRLYFFLTLNASFRDALAFGNPSIQEFLYPNIVKKFFASEYLPGLNAALHPNGRWTRNRKLLAPEVDKPKLRKERAARKFASVPADFPTFSPLGMSEPSTASSAQSVLIPGNLSPEFDTSSQITVMQRHMESQNTMIFQQAQDTRSLLEKTDRMATALENLANHLMRQSLSPGTNGGPGK